ncbi:hypothetical protein, partial [Actinobacillus equuli]
MDDDTINIVNYVNERDLSYLRNKVSDTDRAMYYAMDITNWPMVVMGMRGLVTNNSKAALTSATASMGINAGGQYIFNKEVNLSDLAIAGVIGKATAGKSLSETVISNMAGSHYSNNINRSDNSALATLSTGIAAAGGYKSTEIIGNKLNNMVNPTY